MVPKGEGANRTRTAQGRGLTSIQGHSKNLGSHMSKLGMG